MRKPKIICVKLRKSESISCDSVRSGRYVDIRPVENEEDEGVFYSEEEYQEFLKNKKKQQRK